MALGDPKTNYGPYKRVTAAEAFGIPGCWLDVDIAHKVHRKQRLPETEEQALAIVRSVWEAPPTMTTSAGHGLHLYWLFDGGPWLLDVNSRPRADALVEGFQRTMQAAFKAHGFELDSTFELARVLRLPGSVNLKDTDNPVRCELRTWDGPRYTLEDLEAVVSEEAWEKVASKAATKAATKAASSARRSQAEETSTSTMEEEASEEASEQPAQDGAGLLLSADRRMDRDRRETFFAASPSARGNFFHSRRLPEGADSSLSAYDLKLANAAVQAGPRRPGLRGLAD